MKNNCGCSEPVNVTKGECYYIPPNVKTLLIRRNKKGKLQIKVNGVGRWIEAEFNEVTRMLKYTA